jgi:amino acid transporter
MSSVWGKTNVRHRTPAAAIWLASGLAFAALIYSGSLVIITSISVVGCYLAYATPIYLGWRCKPRWVDKRGPWHLGRHSNLINMLALGWVGFSCILMIMPPNVRTGISMGAVITILFLLHRFTGPHQMRKPIWNVTQTATTNRPEP